MTTLLLPAIIAGWTQLDANAKPDFELPQARKRESAAWGGCEPIRQVMTYNRQVAVARRLPTALQPLPSTASMTWYPTIWP
ncbi:hypothetical protein CH292_26555 [Rhodococcus sp. 14-2470-1a]|nr:hypothetical protein CH292_26555 [Rhodococcus sp. 14-2470-1a]